MHPPPSRGKTAVSGCPLSRYSRRPALAGSGAATMGNGSERGVGRMGANGKVGRGDPNGACVDGAAPGLGHSRATGERLPVASGQSEPAPARGGPGRGGRGPADRDDSSTNRDAFCQSDNRAAGHAVTVHPDPAPTSECKTCAGKIGCRHHCNGRHWRNHAARESCAHSDAKRARAGSCARRSYARSPSGALCCHARHQCWYSSRFAVAMGGRRNLARVAGHRAGVVAATPGRRRAAVCQADSFG